MNGKIKEELENKIYGVERNEPYDELTELFRSDDNMSELEADEFRLDMDLLLKGYSMEEVRENRFRIRRKRIAASTQEGQ